MSRPRIIHPHLIHESINLFLIDYWVIKYTARARTRPWVLPAPKYDWVSPPQWLLTHFWPSFPGLCSLFTSLLVYVGHFFQNVITYCYFLFCNIKNPSFSSTFSCFLTCSYFQLVIYNNIVFLLKFGNLGNFRDTTMGCTVAVFLPFETTLGSFGDVLVNSWGLLGRQDDQDAPRAPKDASRRPPRHPQRLHRYTPETSNRPKNCSKFYSLFVITFCAISLSLCYALTPARRNARSD